MSTFSLPVRPLVSADIECYCNYFCICFTEIGGKGRRKHFEFYEGHPLDVPGIVRILRNFTLVTFNGNIYDIPILRLALRAGVTNRLLKEATNEIIGRNKRVWEIEDKYRLVNLPMLDHIDLVEPAPSVLVPLKLYGGRLHSKRLQDLPIPHDSMIGPEQREILVSYCYNDTDTNVDLYYHIEKQIELRTSMSNQYGLDVRSKSDAQIAEAVIRAELERIKGESISRPEFSPDYSFHYLPPDFLAFKTQKMREVFKVVTDATFRLKKKQVKDDDDDSDAVSVGGVKVKISGIQMPPEIVGAKPVRDPVTKKIVTPKRPPLLITIGETTYKMGIGGLHSTESKVVNSTDDDYVIVDADVASYYPSIMLACELYPDHLGPDFLDVYRGIKERRIVAKRAKDKVTDMTLKIVLNGTFGKLGSKWSVLYSPNLMLQVTITGQLALLMLIERLELAGIRVISANTDGIVARVPRDKLDTYREIVAEWEKRTSFEMEFVIYRNLWSRDVNNYLAEKMPFAEEKSAYRDLWPSKDDDWLTNEFGKGGVKQKGAFAFAGSKGSPAEKNPTSYVCIDAVINYLTKGTPLDETIEWCPDIRRFLTVRRVTNGALYDGEYLGKVVRFYYGRGCNKHIEYADDGRRVANSQGAIPLMELPERLPMDIDYDYYRNEAISMLGDLGVL